jgi:hypothetical protein
MIWVATVKEYFLSLFKKQQTIAMKEDRSNFWGDSSKIDVYQTGSTEQKTICITNLLKILVCFFSLERKMTLIPLLIEVCAYYNHLKPGDELYEKISWRGVEFEETCPCS